MGGVMSSFSSFWQKTHLLQVLSFLHFQYEFINSNFTFTRRSKKLQHRLSLFKIVMNLYADDSGVFLSVQFLRLARCSWDSWAYFHLPRTKTALGPPCSSLIIHIQARASWQVCWSHSMFCYWDNTFSLCGQKNAEAITLLEAGLVRPDWGRGSESELYSALPTRLSLDNSAAKQSLSGIYQYKTAF